MAISKSAGRQWPQIAIVEYTYADFTSGVGVEAVDLPPGARVVGGYNGILTAFDSATSDTIEIGDATTAARYLSDDGQAAGGSALVPTGLEYTEGGAITIEWTGVGAAPSAGAGVLAVMYTIDGRANETQDR